MAKKGRLNKSISGFAKDVDLEKLSKSRPLKARKTAAEQVSGPEYTVKWRTFFALLAIIGAIAFLTYFNTLWAGLVFNDKATMTLVGAGQHLDAYLAVLWQRAFTHPLMQPWTSASFALDIANYGSAIAWYHLVNIFLHVCACLFFYLLTFAISTKLSRQARFALDPYKFSFFAAALFACHPLASQSVDYISARSSLLSTVNFFFALNTFLLGYYGESTESKFTGYGLSLAALMMSLTSGQEALSLPLTMLALVFLLMEPGVFWFDEVRRHPITIAIVSLAAVTFPYLILTGIQPAGVPDSLTLAPPDPQLYWTTQLKALVTYYMRCALLPIGLSIDPPFARASGWLDPFVFLGGAVLLALPVACVFLRKIPILVWAIALILVGYVPHAFLFQQDIVGDRFFYLSLSGVCLALSWAALRFCKLNSSDEIKAAGAIILVLIALTIWRNSEWFSDDALMQSTLRANPRSILARTMLCWKYLRVGEIKQALAEADKVLQIDPHSAVAHLSKGTAYSDRGDYEKSRDEYQLALNESLKQHLSDAVLNTCKLGLAESKARTGDTKGVTQLVYSTLESAPNNPRPVFIMGLAAFQDHDYRKALVYLRSALQRDQSPKDGFGYLARAAFHEKQYKEAHSAAQFNTISDQSAAASILLARTAMATNRIEDARQALREALKTNPADVEAFVLLSKLEEYAGEKTLAEGYHADAVKLQSNAFSQVEMPVFNVPDQLESDDKATGQKVSGEKTAGKKVNGKKVERK